MCLPSYFLLIFWFNLFQEFVNSIPDLAKEISKNKLLNEEKNTSDNNVNLPPVRNTKEPILIKGSKDAKAAKSVPDAKPKPTSTVRFYKIFKCSYVDLS